MCNKMSYTIRWLAFCHVHFGVCSCITVCVTLGCDYICCVLYVPLFQHLGKLILKSTLGVLNKLVSCYLFNCLQFDSQQRRQIIKEGALHIVESLKGIKQQSNNIVYEDLQQVLKYLLISF